MPDALASWCVAVTVPRAHVDVCVDALLEDVGAVSSFGEEDDPAWLIEGFAAAKPDRVALQVKLGLLAGALGFPEPVVTVTPVPATDWLAASFAAFPPLTVGLFRIQGSHITDPPPPGRLTLRVDAATAFGSGEHPTTEGCLIAIDRLAKRVRRGGFWPARMLDMGAGTGILAMAAALRLPGGVRVLACDLDAESARVARVNARVNRLAGRVTVRAGDGYRPAAVAKAGPYGLIVSNILAGPLSAMAPALARHLAPGGHAILSGLLEHQERQVLAAHRAQGLHLTGRVVRGRWPTLVLKKTTRHGQN